ncbi:MAG: hypothetical protein H7061_01885 [Bdellovibrionaceae bacterium]|nr:hypothetical protein [Bdellovibrio sp.]
MDNAVTLDFIKPLLAELSSAFLNFHRELLFSQAALVEKSEGRQYQPYELLNLSLNDERFVWLKNFSDLILKIDIITDDKENKPYDAQAIVTEIKNLITGQSSPDYNRAIKADTTLMLSLGEVRKALTKLETVLKNK